MSQSHSHSHNDAQQSQDFSPQQTNIQQPANTDERSIDNINSYIRISGRQERIDEQEILKEFHNRRSEEQRRNSRAIGRKLKVGKTGQQSTGKKFDFGYMRRKWKAQIYSNTQKYKQYLLQHKSASDSKQKQFMLSFFKTLLDGLFQLRDYSQSPHNDLTSNQRKIIDRDSDQFVWLRDIVNGFDREFKQAKCEGKIQSVGERWKVLIKNCRDESNFELRRKIIRLKVKPIHVIMNRSEFLMSEQAKLQAQRLRKLILAEADKNFKQPIPQQQPLQISSDSSQLNNLTTTHLPDQLQSQRSMSATDNMRLNQQRQRLDEYKEFINQREEMLRRRIEELLEGTTSQKRVMGNFLRVFGGN